MGIESGKKQSEPINKKWCKADMPDLSGKTAVVTGANSGIGYEVSKALAAKGAEVVMTCRSVDKGESAATIMKQEIPDASLRIMHLDLADLSSIRAFTHTFQEDHSSLHILCNNAGVMQTPQRQTVDGFELQFGTNHLGHFALTGLLLELLLQTDGSRVVTVSSTMHRQGKINFDDLMMEREYGRTAAYAQSKLANLLFTYELQRKLDSHESPTISVAAHPGYSATNLQITGPGMDGGRLMLWGYRILNKLLAQSGEMGALPILYAATAEDVDGGDYIGPGGFAQLRGYPKKVKSSNLSYDEEVARRLWEISTELTQVQYNFLTSRA